MNWETYQNAYKKASPELQELLDSEKIPFCVRSSLEMRSLLSLRKKAAAEIAAYTVGAQTLDETANNLAQAGIPDVLQFLAEVQTCIKQGYTLPTSITEPAATSLVSEITATEKEFASLHTVRTMPQDMAAIKPGSDTVYQSSQADILNQAAAPIPISEEPPRWDTETKQ